MDQIATRLLCARIMFHTRLARIVPLSLSSWVENQAQDLLKLSAHARPMRKASARLGMPYLGAAVCVDIDCRNRWMVFAPDGVDPNIDLECARCHQDTGVLV